MSMTQTHKMETKIEEKTVIFTRIINAPRELVYRAFTEPEMLKQWFSPKTFHTPTVVTDVRVGGAFRIVMADSEGNEFPMKGFYLEVEPNQRLVFTEDLTEHPEEWKTLLQNAAGEGEDIMHTKAEFIFETVAEGTKVTVISRFSTNAVRDAYKETGMVDGWTQLFEKLDTLVASAQI